MNPSFLSTLKSKIGLDRPGGKRRFFLVLCLAAITLLNAKDLIKAVQEIHSYKKVLPYQNIGYKFAGLEEFLKGQEIVGYYTDEDIAQQEASKQFSHAQFILTPTILDFNNLDHEYVIFFCSKESVAWKKIEEIHAEPFRRNQFGVILARKVKGNTNPFLLEQ